MFRDMYIFYHFKYFYTSLFYCIQLNFLILFPITLDIYFYLINNKHIIIYYLSKTWKQANFKDRQLCPRAYNERPKELRRDSSTFLLKLKNGQRAMYSQGNNNLQTSSTFQEISREVTRVRHAKGDAKTKGKFSLAYHFAFHKKWRTRAGRV